MKTLQISVPDSLMHQVEEISDQERVSLDQIVSIALAAQVAAWQVRQKLGERARQVDWKEVDDILARVPDGAPVAGDEI